MNELPVGDLAAVMIARRVAEAGYEPSLSLRDGGKEWVVRVIDWNPEREARYVAGFGFRVSHVEAQKVAVGAFVERVVRSLARAIEEEKQKGAAP